METGLGPIAQIDAAAGPAAATRAMFSTVRRRISALIDSGV